MFTRQKGFVLGVVLLVSPLALLSPLRPGVICGESMSPTLKSGQAFVLDRLAYQRQPIRRNDILVFERNGTSYVKRVAALEGDSFFVLRYYDTGWDQPILPNELPRLRRLLKHATGIPARVVRRSVPSGYCYVLGDAANCSEDSRYFGPVPLESVRGRLLMSPTLAPMAIRLASTNGPIRL